MARRDDVAPAVAEVGNDPCGLPRGAFRSSSLVVGQEDRRQGLGTSDDALDRHDAVSPPGAQPAICGKAGEPMAYGPPRRPHEPFETEALARLLAHELRTPLHVLRGFTEILLSGDAGGIPADVAAALCEIAGASRLLDTTLAALGDLAAIAAPSRSGCRVAVDLGVELRRAGFELDAASAGVQRTIMGDPSLLETGLAAARRWLERGSSGQAPPLARLRFVGDGSVRAILGGTWRGRRVADLGGLDRLLASVAMAELGGRASDEGLDLVLDWPPETGRHPGHLNRQGELCA